ncbi:acetyltransferase At1g77540-like [Andrographis paniculata]|uniref:acetyltransferase At1g77540-like n=1 Tax=Andrographis paniculata TaxID=175694 RepID=UPI0021E93CF8|nr:acetyltransferase At1g77540-like [Andrographis paniculata]
MAEEKTTATASAIVWNEKERKFETADREAYLEYKVRGDGGKVMDITHTYVPPSKRGSGVAGRLCAAAFSHALNRSMSVIPTCSYASGTYLPQNPNWNSILFQEGVKSRL